MGASDLAGAAGEAVLRTLTEAATVLHDGDTPVRTKVDWVVRTMGALTDASATAYVDLGDGRRRFRRLHGEAAPRLRALLDDTAATLIEDAGQRIQPQSVDDADPDHSLVVAPVRGIGEEAPLHGLLALLAPPETRDRPLIAVIEVLAVHLGVALDNAGTISQLSELQAVREVAVQRLQEAVSPPTPQLENAELGVHYQPADPGSPIGGDLYDWYLLPDGDLHVAVVDVAGHGVTATKDALAVAHTLRVLVLENCPMEEVVGRADEVLVQGELSLMATLLVGRYTPSSGRLQLAGAGHPPALAVSPEGNVEQLEAPGIPIGWPGAGSRRIVERELEHNEALVLYTDGVIEATRDVLRGLRDLEKAATEVAAYPAQFLARGIVERALAGARHQDDSLALVLRHRVLDRPTKPRIGPLRYRFSPSTVTIPLARHLLADWIGYQPIEPSCHDDLLFVATELCTNAIQASSGAPGSLELRAAIEADAVTIEVEDDGGGYELDAGEEAPDPEVSSGRGLFLVRSLTDEITVNRRDGRTVTRCVRRGAVLRDDETHSPRL